MKTFKTFTALFIVLCAMFFSATAFSQESPVLYFCEDYRSGEVNISDVFTTGYLTVMVKSDRQIGYRDVEIRMYKYNQFSDGFDFYNTVDFTITPSMDYVYFQDKNKLSFDSPGFYRVQLTSSGGGTVIASGIIRIISR